MGEDHVLAHVLGVRARVADAAQAVDRVQLAQQLGEGRPLGPQIAAVGVHVLAEQRDLRDAVGGQPPPLGHELGERARNLAPARRRHDAERTLHVAADGDLQPGLRGARALVRQVSGEPLELEKALRGERFRGEELGQLVDLAGAEGDVDERELAEHLVLDRLGPASADADQPLRVAPLERLRLVQVRDEALVGLLADRAGVEQDQVRVGPLGHLAIAERLEHALHALGVVLVHLAPEGRDVKGLHPAIERSPSRATP